MLIQSVNSLQIIGAIFAMGFGSLVQGSVGFGMALVAVPLIALINPILVPGPILVCGFVLSVLVTIRDGRSIDVSGLGWALGGRVIGSLVGAMILTYLNGAALSITFGTIIILMVGISALGIYIPQSLRNIGIAGICSGITGTTVSIGGPPMALIYQNEKGARLRSTLSGFFIFGTIISISSLITVGQFRMPHLITGLTIAPGVIIGFFISNILKVHVDKHSAKKYILALSGLGGVIIIVRALVN